MPRLPFACLILGLAAAPSAADDFRLTVNDMSGLKQPWPLVAGLPFHEGQLRDASRVRIIRDGQAIPAQVDVTATWRDGSIRWALVSCTGSPDAQYVVEYDSQRSERTTTGGKMVRRTAAGGLIIDTGSAVYEFDSQGLLPQRMRAGGAVVLADAAAGAYLIDNAGRLSRVAGSTAEVSTKVLVHGPQRAVIYRAGWYVTEQGDRTARAEAWFYFAADSAAVRITHSLILTEDTNTLWIREYGLEFATEPSTREVSFAQGEPGSGKRKDVAVDDAEVYMAQQTYPHFRNRDSRAVIGRDTGERTETVRESGVAGDWATAQWQDGGLTVVLPWLAQQFPKEIAFSPTRAKVAFWSARCGRELDFRAATLVDEYWKDWIDNVVDRADANVREVVNRYWKQDREPRGAEALRQWPSNAQGAARTHDLWLLPYVGEVDQQTLDARAHAAARPPLVLAEPSWLCDTGAIGWPIHPKDEARFPDAEALIDRYWNRLMRQFDDLPRTGFIARGCQPYLSTGKMFRHGILCDYALRRGVWGLYGRSGERRYYEYGSRFNRYIGDWWVAHWTVGTRVRGGFVSPGGYWEGHLPFVWGNQSRPLTADSSGHDVRNWLLEYYLTGDEYALHMFQLVAEATRKHWWDEQSLAAETGNVLRRWHIPMVLQRLASIYGHTWDETYLEMARDLAAHLINLENPNGLTDKMSGGALYKWTRNAHSLREYDRVTGELRAREALLKLLDYNYRFPMITSPFDSTNHAALLYTLGYEWTGRRDYLRVVNQLVQDSLVVERTPGGPHACAHPTMGVPAALTILDKAEGPIAPYPLLEFKQDADPTPIVFETMAGRETRLGVFVRLRKDEDENAQADVQLRASDGQVVDNLKVRRQRAFRSISPVSGNRERDRYLEITIPAGAEPDRHNLTLPNAAWIRMIDADGVKLDAASR